MKKGLLLLMLCIGSIYTHAQQIDKKLLIGRWDLYSMESGGYSVCRDSIPAIRKEMSQREVGYMSNDSKKIDQKHANDIIQRIYIDVFNIYLTYDEKGQVAMLWRGKEKENAQHPPQTGTYRWTGKNKITQTFSKSPPIEFTVVTLTSTRLVIKNEDSATNMTAVMAYTRAK